MITNPIQVKITNLNLTNSYYIIAIFLNNYLEKCVPYNTKNNMQHNCKVSSVFPTFSSQTSGNVLESFIFLGIIFHNIAPLKSSEFIRYFVVLTK